MFTRRIPFQKYFAFTLILVLMGFFASMLHITPQLLHHVVADAHDEHSPNQGVYVDHHVLISHSSRDQGQVLVVAAIPSFNFEIFSMAGTDSISDSYTVLYDPPNKTPLYINNNIFLI